MTLLLSCLMCVGIIVGTLVSSYYAWRIGVKEGYGCAMWPSDPQFARARKHIEWVFGKTGVDSPFLGKEEKPQ